MHKVELSLPRDRPVAIIDYPAAVPCLAALNCKQIPRADGRRINWNTRERWELYAGGVELANCYTELRDEDEIRKYMESENKEKQQSARIPHPPVTDFNRVCARMPPCSGSALGLDRLIMLLAGKSTLDSVLPFPLTDGI